MVSESDAIGSRSKGSLPMTIVVACEAGRRSTRSTLLRLGRVTVGSALVDNSDAQCTSRSPTPIRLIRSPSLLESGSRTHSACVTPASKVRWYPFITAWTGGTLSEIGAWSSGGCGNLFCATPPILERIGIGACVALNPKPALRRARTLAGPRAPPGSGTLPRRLDRGETPTARGGTATRQKAQDLPYVVAYITSPLLRRL